MASSMTSTGGSSPGELKAWEKFLQETVQDPLICLAVARISEGDHGDIACASCEHTKRFKWKSMSVFRGRDLHSEL